LIGPWIIFKQLFGLSVGNEPTFSAAGLVSGFTFHPETILKMLEKMFLSGNWHLLFGLWVLVMIFYYKKIFTTEKKYIFWSTALAIIFFAFLYVFTYNWTMVFSGIILNRNFLTLAPQILLLCGLVFEQGGLNVRDVDRPPARARGPKGKKARK
jgi:signal transduction histidine kinase